MINIFESNGIVLWNESEIQLRESFINYFLNNIKTHLWEMNSAWRFERCDAPLLIPSSLLNPEYKESDVFFQSGSDLVLRPETTLGSYYYAKHLLNPHSSKKTKLPLCVWQAGKSFRREQDQVTKNMRLKEFYQLEFQCIYSENTACDYYHNILLSALNDFNALIGDCLLVNSDRLPSYSEETNDIICSLSGDQTMELASISLRNDLEGMKVLEIAIGLDRLLYCFDKKKEGLKQ